MGQGEKKGQAAEDLGPDVDEWEQQHGESPQAFAAFVVYRDDARSVRKTAAIVGKSRNLIGTWSSKNRWIARCAAWDREQDRLRRERNFKARAELEERHAKEAHELLDTLLLPARQLVSRWRKRKHESPDADPFESLSDLDLMREAIKAARVYKDVGVFERLSRGMSTSNVGGHDGGPIEQRERVENMPRDEIEAYLLGIDAGARHAAEKHGLPAPPEQLAEK